MGDLQDGDSTPASDSSPPGRYDSGTTLVSSIATHHFVDTNITPRPQPCLAAAPRWVDRFFVGLLVYVGVCIIWMLAGIGGKQVTHFVGLLSDAPADFAATLLALTAARRARSLP